MVKENGDKNTGAVLMLLGTIVAVEQAGRIATGERGSESDS